MPADWIVAPRDVIRRPTFSFAAAQTLHTPYGEQDENGTDLSLIRELLRLTPQERLRRGDSATTDMLRVREYARRIEAEPA